MLKTLLKSRTSNNFRFVFSSGIMYSIKSRKFSSDPTGCLSPDKKNENKQKNNYSKLLKYTFCAGIIATSLFVGKKVYEYIDVYDETESYKKYDVNDIHNISVSQFKDLHKIIYTFLRDDIYVYKVCNDKWLIIMKYVPGCVNNENRKTYCAKNAKYRGSKFEVVMIINIEDPSKTINKLENTYTNSIFESKIVYEVHKIVEPEKEFDKIIDNVCSSGIHYFKNIFRALGWRDRPLNFTGKWIYYDDDGEIFSVFEYSNKKPN